MNAVSAEFDVGTRTAVGLLLPPALTESFEMVLARAVDLSRDPYIDLTLLVCNGTVRGCAVSVVSSRALCSHCRTVRDTALLELVPGVAVVPIDRLASAAVAAGTVSHDVETELDNGVFSTLKTFYRVDVHSKLTPLLRRLVFLPVTRKWKKYSRFTYVALRQYLAYAKPGRLEFFNGRIVPTRGALTAALEAGGSYGVVEVWGEQKALFTTENRLIHDLDFWRDEIMAYCRSNQPDIKLGQRFYERRRGGLQTDAISFTDRQVQGLVPDFGDGAVVTVFTSSPDEIEVSGPQWFTPASTDPTRFLRELRQALPDTYRIVVRMHPNQHGDRTGQSLRMLEEMSRTTGVTVFEPKAPLSSYELLDRSDFVVTFGSTIGLEATYWGKPSFLAGRATWEDLDVNYKVKDARETAALIVAGSPARSRDDAVRAASFIMESRGQSTTLTFGDGGGYGFFVEGKSYIALKRKSLVYVLARAIDKIMRLRW